jgi:hypothetical protein
MDEIVGLLQMARAALHEHRNDEAMHLVRRAFRLMMDCDAVKLDHNDRLALSGMIEVVGDFIDRHLVRETLQ